MKKPIVIATVVAAISLSTVFAVTNAENHDNEKHEHKEKLHTDDAHDHDEKKKDHEDGEHHKGESKEHDDHGDEEKGEGHDEGKGDGHGHGEAAADAELSSAQLKQAGIEIITISQGAVSEQITAPAEIMLNQYKTSQVTAKVTSQVKKRFVRLGDHVKKGQKLAVVKAVTTPELAANMISIANLEAGLAGAKGDLRAADAEWKRVKSIGKDLISQKRIDDAQIAHEQAAAQVNAYKNSQKKMQGLLSTGTSRNSTLTITAPQAGTIISDKFVNGQVMEASGVLFEISDMSHLWVEARIKPNVINSIQKGSNVAVKVGKQSLQGKVINVGRVLDEKTKTLSVRIELNTESPSLYPGQFVQAHISSSETHTGIAVPNQAVLRSPDGDWMVLVEAAEGRFEPKEIEVKQNIGDKTVIAGIEAGTKIVSKGAFFVQSEIAKSGFEVHNH